MRSTPLRVDAATAAILHEAYYKIFAAGSDYFAMYDCVRSTLSKIVHLDSFYVGLLQGQTKVRYPYGFEGGRFDDPVLHTVGANGPTAWLLQHRQTYRFSYDDGAVLNTGVSFGDVRRRSADAVTVPLLRPADADEGASVFGMISMHSYTSSAFDDEAVRAAEWLAEVLSRALMRREEDETALAQLGLGDGNEQQVLSSHHVIEYLSTRLGTIRREADELLELENPEADAVLEMVRRVVGRLEQVQSGLIELTRSTDPAPARRFLSLTEAERAVAMLLCSGMSTEAMAGELGVKASTIKTHVKHIMAKYEMSVRSDVAADVRRHLS